MKDAREWVDEYTQSGAFDLIDSVDEAIKLIKEIQDEAFYEGIGAMLAGQTR